MRFLFGFLFGVLLSLVVPTWADFVTKDFTHENRRLDLFLTQVQDRINDMTKIKDYTLSNVTTDRTLDADSTTLAEVADFVGTLAQDLTDAQILK